MPDGQKPSGIFCFGGIRGAHATRVLIAATRRNVLQDQAPRTKLAKAGRLRQHASRVCSPDCNPSSSIYNLQFPNRGHSSVGRAPALQAGCQGFESPCLHFVPWRDALRRVRLDAFDRIMGRHSTYFFFTNSGRFRSSSGSGINLTSWKFFFNPSRNVGALPTMTRLGGVSKYFSANALTSFAVTAFTEGTNVFRVSSGRSCVMRDATLLT